MSATAARLGQTDDAARILGASRALAPRRGLTAADRTVDIDVEARLHGALGPRMDELLAEGSALGRDASLALAERMMAGAGEPDASSVDRRPS